MRGWSASLALALAATACSNPDDPRAPFKPTCLEDCRPRPGGGVVPHVPEGGAGGGGGVGSDGGVRTLSARVWTLGDRSFVTRAPYDGAGTLAVQGPTFAVASEFAASPVTVPEVEASDILWVAAIPARGTADVMTTVQAVSGTATSVDVDLARPSVMNDVLTGATQANPPPQLDATRAQLVLTFVDQNELAVRDIEIAQHNGVSVLYDVGNDTYSDTVANTGERGTAIVVNAQARPAASGSPFPGGTLVLTYRSTSASSVGSFEVFAAAGAVTFASVRVPR